MISKSSRKQIGLLPRVTLRVLRTRQLNRHFLGVLWDSGDVTEVASHSYCHLLLGRRADIPQQHIWTPCSNMLRQLRSLADTVFSSQNHVCETARFNRLRANALGQPRRPWQATRHKGSVSVERKFTRV